MRRLFFALVMLMAGGFMVGAGAPANAMTAGAVTSMSDVVKSDATLNKAYHWRRGFCWRHPYHWRCRHRHYRRHYRPYWRRHWW
jgi:hypothetical protein